MKTTKIGLFLGALLASSVATSISFAKPRQVGSGAGCERLASSTEAARSFYGPGNVYAVKEVKRKVFRARAIQYMRTVGAELYVRAEPGVTREYLHRALSCQVAGAGAAQHPNDPLHPSGGRVSELGVRSAGGSFAVSVVGDSLTTGREIYERARAFAAPGGAVNVEQIALRSATPEL